MFVCVLCGVSIFVRAWLNQNENATTTTYGGERASLSLSSLGLRSGA